MGYTVRYFLLWRSISIAVKHDFQPYIHNIPAHMKNLNIVIPHSNVFFLTFTCQKLTIWHRILGFLAT